MRENRQTRPEVVVVTASLLSLILLPLGQLQPLLGVMGALIAIGAAVVGVRLRVWPAVRVCTLTILLTVAGMAGIPFAVWLAVAGLWLAGSRFSPLRPDSGWLPTGRNSATTWALTAVLVLVAAIGLTVWIRAVPEPAESTMDLVELAREASPIVVVSFVIIFVIANATAEEIAYRGIAQEAARSVLSPAGAVAAQAVAFATLHVVGFPAGTSGVAMSFGYGVMLGVLRHLTGGLRVPIIAHMAADATIAILVVTLIVPG